MKRTKQFRKIKWALHNLHGRKKRKFESKFSKLVAMAMSFWWKMFPTRKKCNEIDDKAKKSVSDYKHVKIQLHEIYCSENSAKNYFGDNGLIYTKNSSYKTTTYLVCKHASSKSCGARAIVKNNNFDEVVLVEGHNHEADFLEVDRAKFSKTLERICIENPFLKPLECYTKAKRELKGQLFNRKHIDGPSFYRTFMHRKQKLSIPLLPHTIGQFEELIAQAKNSSRFAYDDVGERFFRGVWRGKTGDNVAFVSERTLKEVRELDSVTFLMDGTFKAITKHLKFCQLYIISVIIKGRCYPLTYILMEKKDYVSYMLVFDEIKKLIPSLKVENCMSDYEAATRKALKKQFPTSRISGCFFHYVQAINKAAKRFGLKSKKDKETFKDAINNVCALALLPNDFVVEGFNLISKKTQKSLRWNRFEKYWRRQWAKANISVYGLIHRTNNFAESLNRTINLLTVNKYPHIWKLIHTLISVEMLRSDELEQVVGGSMLTSKCKPKKKMVRLNKKIKKATKKFNKTKDVEAFLNNITFNESLPNVFWKSGCESDDNFDEEIIPNTFDENNNFFKHTAAKKRKLSSKESSNKRQRK